MNKACIDPVESTVFQIFSVLCLRLNFCFMNHCSLKDTGYARSKFLSHPKLIVELGLLLFKHHGYRVIEKYCNEILK